MQTSFVTRVSFVFFCGSVFLFLFSFKAEAALLYLDPAEAEIFRGDTVTMAVRVDTDEGECINAADVVIEYGEGIRAIDVSRGESILNLWPQVPIIDEENRTVSFAGGLPGGYCGRIPGDPRLTNILVEIVFRSPGLAIGGGNNRVVPVQFSDTSRLLLNDGFGTDAPLRVRDALLTLRDTAGSATDDDWNARITDDTIPPADFSITLSRDTNAFSGKYFIVFNSQDKQSGIDHYEVMEEPFEDFELFKWGAADAEWQHVESPYVLIDQTLNSTVRVRAIDKAGNETMSVLVPEPALRSMSRDRTLTILLILLIGVVVAASVGYGLYRRKQKLIETYEHEEQQHE